jgi:hypothetical protein
LIVDGFAGCSFSPKWLCRYKLYLKSIFLLSYCLHYVHRADISTQSCTSKNTFQFSAKKLAFFSKPMLWSQFCSSLSKKRQFFRRIFRRKYLKIIISVPGGCRHSVPLCHRSLLITRPRETEESLRGSRSRIWQLSYEHFRPRCVETRVARLLIFIPQIPIGVYFGGLWHGKCWYILWPFGIFYGQLVSFGVIWYIFSRFGMFEPRKIWQPWLQRKAMYCLLD